MLAIPGGEYSFDEIRIETQSVNRPLVWTPLISVKILDWISLRVNKALGCKKIVIFEVHLKISMAHNSALLSVSL